MKAKNTGKATDEITTCDDTSRIIQDLDCVIKEMHETMEDIRELLGEIGKERNTGVMLKNKKTPLYRGNVN